MILKNAETRRVLYQSLLDAEENNSSTDLLSKIIGLLGGDHPLVKAFQKIFNVQPEQTDCYQSNGVCVPCTVCNSPSEVIKSECTSVANRVCSCSPGYVGTPGNCIACSAGQYSDTQSNTCKICTTSCPAGQQISTPCQKNADTQCSGCTTGNYYTPTGCTPCSSCPMGYQETSTCTTTTNRACTQCPIGKYSNEVNSPQCTECPTGTYAEVGQSSCSNCEPGKVIGSSGCQSCGAGKYTDGPETCADCPRGWYSQASTNMDCQECPLNTYQSNEGASSCLACPAGTQSLEKGATECVPCPAGTGYVGNSCQACVAGKFGVLGNTGACQSCPAGYYADEEGSDSCQGCVAGKYSAIGALTCEDCPAGTYSNINAASCVDCVAGKYSASASSNCIDCPSGTISSVRQSTCQACNAGEYAASATTCTQCADGHYSSAGAAVCDVCPAGTAASAGASSCDACAVNTISQAGASTCTACPSQQYSQDNVCREHCVAGKFDDGEQCKDCPAGYYTASQDLRECTACPTDYITQGIAANVCTQCPAGYYSQDNECKISSIDAVCTVAALTVFLLSYYYLFSHAAHATTKYSKYLAYAFLALAVFSPVIYLGSKAGNKSFSGVGPIIIILTIILQIVNFVLTTVNRASKCNIKNEAECKEKFVAPGKIEFSECVGETPAVCRCLDANCNCKHYMTKIIDAPSNKKECDFKQKCQCNSFTKESPFVCKTSQSECECSGPSCACTSGYVLNKEKCEVCTCNNKMNFESNAHLTCTADNKNSCFCTDCDCASGFTKRIEGNKIMCVASTEATKECLGKCGISYQDPAFVDVECDEKGELKKTPCTCKGENVVMQQGKCQCKEGTVHNEQKHTCDAGCGECSEFKKGKGKVFCENNLFSKNKCKCDRKSSDCECNAGFHFDKEKVYCEDCDCSKFKDKDSDLLYCDSKTCKCRTKNACPCNSGYFLDETGLLCKNCGPGEFLFKNGDNTYTCSKNPKEICTGTTEIFLRDGAHECVLSHRKSEFCSGKSIYKESVTFEVDSKTSDTVVIHQCLDEATIKSICESKDTNPFMFVDDGIYECKNPKSVCKSSSTGTKLLLQQISEHKEICFTEQEKTSICSSKKLFKNGAFYECKEETSLTCEQNKFLFFQNEVYECNIKCASPNLMFKKDKLHKCVTVLDKCQSGEFMFKDDEGIHECISTLPTCKTPKSILFKNDKGIHECIAKLPTCKTPKSILFKDEKEIHECISTLPTCANSGLIFKNSAGIHECKSSLPSCENGGFIFKNDAGVHECKSKPICENSGFIFKNDAGVHECKPKPSCENSGLIFKNSAGIHECKSNLPICGEKEIMFKYTKSGVHECVNKMKCPAQNTILKLINENAYSCQLKEKHKDCSTKIIFKQTIASVETFECKTEISAITCPDTFKIFETLEPESKLKYITCESAEKKCDPQKLGTYINTPKVHFCCDCSIFSQPDTDIEIACAENRMCYSKKVNDKVCREGMIIQYILFDKSDTSFTLPTENAFTCAEVIKLQIDLNCNKVDQNSLLAGEIVCTEFKEPLEKKYVFELGSDSKQYFGLRMVKGAAKLTLIHNTLATDPKDYDIFVVRGDTESNVIAIKLENTPLQQLKRLEEGSLPTELDQIWRAAV